VLVSAHLATAIGLQFRRQRAPPLAVGLVQADVPNFEVQLDDDDVDETNQRIGEKFPEIFDANGEFGAHGRALIGLWRWLNELVQELVVGIVGVIRIAVAVLGVLIERLAGLFRRKGRARRSR
jgi:hypothetical protein